MTTAATAPTRSAPIATALAAAVVTALSGAGQARADEFPAGKIGLGVGGRYGVGNNLGPAFGPGGLLAVEAGYQPTRPGSSLSLGLNWSIATSWFGYDDTASLSGSLRLLELSFGGRVRRVLGQGTAQFAFVGAGVTLLRSNVPIAPDDDRGYLGPYLSVGGEGWASSYLFGFEIRYGLLTGGPGSLSMILSVSVGA